MPPNLSPWEIYRDDLATLKFGDALWEPGPIYSYRRVRLGDVGYLRKGRFHLLFSAGIPLGTRVLGTDVPLTFVPLEVGPIISGELRPPGHLRSETVLQIGADVGGSIAIAHSVEPGARIAFELTSERGAALVTKYPTYREDIEWETHFKNYTKKHFDSWVDFARGKHGSDLRPILVTGVDLTREFAMVAYSDNKTSTGCEFSAALPGVASTAVSLWGSWHTSGLVHKNCGPDPSRQRRCVDNRPTPESEIPDEYTQCVFVRYYTIIKRAFISFVMKASAGPHQLPEGDYNLEEGLQVLSTDDPIGDDPPEPGSPSVTSDEVIHNVPRDNRDIFDVVAEFIFQESDAKSMLLHHHDIQDFLLGDEENLTRLLSESRIAERVKVDEDGIGQLSLTTTGSPKLIPLDSEIDATPYSNARASGSGGDPGAHISLTAQSLPPGNARVALSPVPATTTTEAVSASILLNKVAHWDGSSRDIEQVLNAAFEAKDYLDCIYRLRTHITDSVLYINSLDKIIDSLQADSELRKCCLQALRKACGIYGRLPTSHNVPFTLIRTKGQQPSLQGDHSFVWRLPDEKGRAFAVKELRVYQRDPIQKTSKRFCEQVVVGKRMNHPNILSIEGAVPNLFEFGMVSRWMENGMISDYVRRYPYVNRLKLLIGVTRGLSYLHGNGVIHGHLKSSDILIGSDGLPRLSNYGLDLREDCALRYCAPELFDSRGRRIDWLREPSGKSDVYSLSMVIVELVTGQMPFPDDPDHNIPVIILRGKRPSKPKSFEERGISAGVWKIAKQCWNKEEGERLETDAVLQALETLFHSGDGPAPFHFMQAWRDFWGWAE